MSVRSAGSWRIDRDSWRSGKHWAGVVVSVAAWIFLWPEWAIVLAVFMIVDVADSWHLIDGSVARVGSPADLVRPVVARQNRLVCLV